MYNNTIQARIENQKQHIILELDCAPHYPYLLWVNTQWSFSFLINSLGWNRRRQVPSRIAAGVFIGLYILNITLHLVYLI